MNWLRQIPLAFYILVCYTCLSGYFAFERIVNTDNSYYFFNILNTQDFWCAENRLSAFFPQIPLVIFSYLGASMQSLVYIYSVSFAVEYLILAFICEYYLRVKEATLTLALGLITGVAYSFFHPVTETYQAIAFAVLLYAVLVSERTQAHKLFYAFGILAALFLCFISHPIGVFLIAFVGLFAFLTKQVKLADAFFVIAFSGIFVVLRVLFTTKGSYDVQQYDNLFAAIRSLNEIAAFYPFSFLQTHGLTTYLSTILLLIALIFLAIKNNYTLMPVKSIVCATGFTLLSIITFSKGDLDMMMEKTFLPAIFMLLLPFCYLFTKHALMPMRGIVIIMAILGFNQIILASHIATRRLEVLESIANKPLHPKLIAEAGDFNEPSLQFNSWNTVVDSYIMAKCKTNKEFTLFITGNKHTFPFDPTDTTLFLGPPWLPYWKKTFLRKTYFNLPGVGYKVYEPKVLNQ
jgi:hypothetical protein